MSKTKVRSVKLYLIDILTSSKAILEYTKGMTEEDLSKDRKTYSAVIREFEIIGEAVAKLPKELKSLYSEIPWRDIKDFRNLLIHEYFAVEPDIIWKVIIDDLPILISTVEKMLNEVKDD